MPYGRTHIDYGCRKWLAWWSATILKAVVGVHEAFAGVHKACVGVHIVLSFVVKQPPGRLSRQGEQGDPGGGREEQGCRLGQPWVRKVKL